MIKITRTFVFSIAILGLLASCSINQDLVQLDEYDDLYYTPAPSGNDVVAYNSTGIDGANSAESSYYGDSPYVDESERPSSEFNNQDDPEYVEENSDDYYDPDYARRIDNFHRDGDPNYVYSDAYANNMNPSFYGSFGMNSFNGFNSGFNSFGFGMTYGSPWMGNRWCDPFFDPFCNRRPWGQPRFGMGWGSTWGMYDPFNPWCGPFNSWNSPYYNPWGWNNPYAYNPYSPWGYNPYYGPGVVVVDGGGGNSSGFQNTPRNGSSRTSRGGIVGNSGDRSKGQVDGSKSNDQKNLVPTDRRGVRGDAETTRTRPTSTKTDYYNRNASRQYSQRDRGVSTDYNRDSRNRSVESPYTRQREQRTRQTPNYNRSRSNSGNSRPNYSRSRSGGNSYSPPSRSRSTSPSRATPTRSRSNNSSTTTTPSRSRSTGGGGSRRR